MCQQEYAWGNDIDETVQKEEIIRGPGSQARRHALHQVRVGDEHTDRHCHAVEKDKCEVDLVRACNQDEEIHDNLNHGTCINEEPPAIFVRYRGHEDVSKNF